MKVRVVRVGSLPLTIGRLCIIFLLYNFVLIDNITTDNQIQVIFSEFSKGTNLGSKSMYNKLGQEFAENNRNEPIFQISKNSTSIQPFSSTVFSGEKRTGIEPHFSNAGTIFQPLQTIVGFYYSGDFHVINDMTCYNSDNGSIKKWNPIWSTFSQFTDSFNGENNTLLVARAKYDSSKFISFSLVTMTNSTVNTVLNATENATLSVNFVAISYGVISNSFTNVTLNGSFVLLNWLVGVTISIMNSSYATSGSTITKHFHFFGELAGYPCNSISTSYERMDLNSTGSYCRNYFNIGGLVKALVNSLGNPFVNSSLFVAEGQNKNNGLLCMYAGNLANSSNIFFITLQGLNLVNWQNNSNYTDAKNTGVLASYFNGNQTKTIDNFSFTNDIVNTNNFFIKLGGLIGNTSSAVTNFYYNTNISNFIAEKGVGKTTKQLSDDLTLFGVWNNKTILYPERYTHQSLHSFSNYFLLFPLNAIIYTTRQSTVIPGMLTYTVIGTVLLYQDGIETTIMQTLDQMILINQNVTGFNISTYNFTMYLETTFEMGISNERFVNIMIPLLFFSPVGLSFDYSTNKKLVSKELAIVHGLSNATLFLSGKQDWKKEVWSKSTISAFDFEPINSGIQTLAREDTGETSRKFNDTVNSKIEPVSILSSPNDTFYPVGATGNTISWRISNFSGQIFSKLFRNGSLTGIILTQNGGRWLNYAIDGLELGTYNYTLVITDNKSFERKDTVMVTVKPVLSVVLSSTNSLFFSVDTTGNMINWTISTDSNSGIVELFRNGSKIGPTLPWNCSTTFGYKVDNLSPGSYNFTIVVVDLNDDKTFGSIIVIAFLPTIIISDPVEPLRTSTSEAHTGLILNQASTKWKLLFPVASPFALIACLGLLVWKQKKSIKCVKSNH